MRTHSHSLHAPTTPFSNSDNLVPSAIYAFSILSITIFIDFILRRLYIINFSIKLSSFFLVFIGGLIFMSIINFKIYHKCEYTYKNELKFLLILNLNVS